LATGLSYSRSRLIFYVIEAEYSIPIFELVSLPLLICTPIATKGSIYLQVKWLTHPASKSCRGIRLPLVYEKCTTGKPASVLKIVRCSAEQSRMFRTVANIFFCVERCGCPLSAAKYIKFLLAMTSLRLLSLLLKISLACQPSCHSRLSRSSGCQRNSHNHVCRETRQKKCVEGRGKEKSCVEIVCR